MNGKGNPYERKPQQETIHRYPTRVGPGAGDVDEVDDQRRPYSRSKKKESWVQENPTLVKGIIAGILLVVLFVLLAWQMGWFGGKKADRPLAGGVPQPAQQPAPPAGEVPQPGPPPGADVPQPAPGVAPPPTDIPQPGPVPQPGPGMPPLEQPPPGEQPKVEEKPPLPEDVKEWKKEDFFRARRERHPKLIEAVKYVGEKFPESENVARNLAELLKPLPPEQPTPGGVEPPAPGTPETPPGSPGVPSPPQPGTPPQPGVPAPQPGMPPGAAPPGVGVPPLTAPYGYQPYAPTDVAALLDAIVTALGNNTTEPARQTIQQILAGTFQTEDDKTAVESALKVIIAHPGAENDALLLRILTEPEALRPAERQGPWPAKDLQSKALEFAKQAASYQLRTRLGEYLVGKRVRIDPKEPLHELLWASNPLNCAAQVAFYLHGNIDKELKPTLEQQLLYYSSLAMRRSLGIPDEFQGGTSPGGGMPMAPLMPGAPPPPAMPAPGMPPLQPFNPGGVQTPGTPPTNVPSNAELTAWLAGQLWSDQFEAELTSQIGSQSLERQARLFLLAGCIPHDAARSAISKALHKRWHDGPGYLESAGFLDWAITDPGLVPVVKMLPRKDYSTPAGGRGPAATPGGRLAEAAQKKQQNEQEWMNFCSKLVSAWCKRLNAAAEAKQKADQDAGNAQELTIADAKLPEGFDVKPDARVVSLYRLRWPDELPEMLAEVNVSPLEVTYVRLEEANRPRKAVTFYTRQAQAKSSDVRSLNNSNKDFWIDNSRVVPQKDRRRSIDILITTPANYTLAQNPKDEDETDLTIEILIIEIRVPPREEVKASPKG